MKTLTLRLPEPLLASIEAEAHDQHTTKSEIVRRRLETAPASPPANATWAAAEKILQEAWAASTPAVRTSYRNPHKQCILDAIRRKKQHRR